MNCVSFSICMTSLMCVTWLMMITVRQIAYWRFFCFRSILSCQTKELLSFLKFLNRSINRTQLIYCWQTINTTIRYLLLWKILTIDLVNAPINVKPLGRGGGATQWNFKSWSSPRVGILTSTMVSWRLLNLTFTRCPGVGDSTLTFRKCQNPLGLPSSHLPWGLTSIGAYN